MKQASQFTVLSVISTKPKYLNYGNTIDVDDMQGIKKYLGLQNSRIATGFFRY
jgi:hypothetical protein